MSADRVTTATPEDPLSRREERLRTIRAEADKKGRVDAIGVRPPGSPFPVASPTTGYYGLPLLKQPPWTWQIPLYFFVGGAAGSAAVIGATARWIVADRELARDCRYIAALGSAASTALLISDLGRPQRFLNMMRVCKLQSPMSVGAWTLAFFGTFSAASAFAELLSRQSHFSPFAILADVAEGISALAGLPFSNYTGVLIGATVIPVWNENAATLPLHFGMSGLNSAVAILELRRHEHRALNLLGVGASFIETAEGIYLESSGKREKEPLKRGVSGLITRVGGILSGPVPLALRLTAAFARKRTAVKLRRAAAVSSIAGSLLTRIAWVQAGHVSAKDWRIPLEVDAVPDILRSRIIPLKSARHAKPMPASHSPDP